MAAHLNSQTGTSAGFTGHHTGAAIFCAFSVPARCLAQTKKADVAEHPEVFHHVGLLVNEPSSYAGLLFI
jgi:hypothetical protein